MNLESESFIFQQCQTKSSVFSSSSGPVARPKRGQGRRVVEVHSQHHLRLQAGPEPYPPR